MTENGKIFTTKTNILNFLAEQLLSIGLSLYIIKDILQELENMYNDIVTKLLKEELKINNILLQNDESNLDIYPVKWEPLEENNLNTSDQAD